MVEIFIGPVPFTALLKTTVSLTWECRNSSIEFGGNSKISVHHQAAWGGVGTPPPPAPWKDSTRVAQ
jgi:hypothetical protein